VSNILIIGGAGYIGSHVVLEFCEQIENVFVFDDLSTGDFNNIDSRAEFIKGSILNSNEIEKAFQISKPSTVIHLAALKATGESMKQPVNYSRTNIVGSLNILEMMVKFLVQNIIFSSTSAVYGDPQYLPIDENHPINPINYYGFTKKSIEEYIIWYSRLKGIRYSILRYFNAAGYDSKGRIRRVEKSSQNLLPIVMEVLIKNRKSISIFGDDYDTKDGTCERDYIHVSDLASAHYLSYKKILKSDENLLLNLATGKKYSILEVINGCEKYLNKPIKFDFTERRLGDTDLLYSNSLLAQSKLGWKPKYSDLRILLTSMYNIYKNRG